MAQKFFRRGKSIAGAVLLGAGMFILFQNLNQTAIRLSHYVGATDALGTLPTFILAASRAAQGYTWNHGRFLPGFIHCIFVSAWPLLLVFGGTVLSRNAVLDAVTDKSTHKS
jgi:hypothetical protein